MHCYGFLESSKYFEIQKQENMEYLQRVQKALKITVYRTVQYIMEVLITSMSSRISFSDNKAPARGEYSQNSFSIFVPWIYNVINFVYAVVVV